MVKRAIATLVFSISTLICSAQLFGPDRKHIDFKLSEHTIDLGGEIKITWDVSYKRQDLEITLNDSIIQPTGSITIQPDTTQIFTLGLKTKQGKMAKRTRKINVIFPRITKFEVTDSVRYNSTANITWRVQNVSKVWLNNKPVDLRGDSSITVTENYPVTLAAENQYGQQISSTNTIHTWYEYKLFSPQGDDKQVYTIAGLPVPIRWEMDHVKELLINGIQTDSTHATINYTVYKDSTLSINAITHNGDAIHKQYQIKKRPVEVKDLSLTNIINPEDKLLDLSAYYEPIKKFAPYRLNWHIDGIIKVELDGEEYPRKYEYKNQAIRNKVHQLVLHYYNEIGQMITDTLEAPLQLHERPIFNGNVISFEEINDEMLFYEVVSVDYSNYPDETKLKVVALNQKGEFVSGLAENNTQSSFKRIVEEYQGNRKVINTIKVTEKNSSSSNFTPQDLMLVFDYSGSMAYEIEKMEAFVRQIIQQKHPEDRMAILKFDDRITEASSFYYSPDSIISAFNKYKLKDLSGWTALYAAGDSALLSFEDNDNLKKVILFTDGYDNASLPYLNQLSINASGLVRKARLKNIPVNLISIGIHVNQHTLNLVSDLTEGHYYPVFDVRDISLAIGEVFHTSRSYYDVSYSSNNRYDGPKTISLVYDDNKGGESTSIKNITNNSNYGKLEAYNLPHLDSQLRIFIDQNRLITVSSTQNLVNFNFNRDRIRPKDKDYLIQYASILTADPALKAVIIGHTDLVGDDDYCTLLSQQRSEAAKEALVNLGISNERLFTIGMGKSSPIWPIEKNDIHALENRRVEILLVKDR